MVHSRFERRCHEGMDCRQGVSTVPRDPPSPPFLRGGVSAKFRLGLLAVLGLFIAGCNKPDEIMRYTVPKPPPREVDEKVSNAEYAGNPHAGLKSSPASPAVPEGPAQLLGAIIPHGKMTWFFKLTGPSEAVSEQLKPFAMFLKSIKFTDKGPDWALPEGWDEEPGSQMRFATIRIKSAEGPLEMSVIPLPTGEGSFDAQLLANVNRWRGQFGLEPIAENQLAEHAHKIDLDDTPMWLVKFEGRMTASSGMGTPPAFAGNAAGNSAGNAPGTASANRRKPKAASSVAAPLPFDCEIPSGWTAGPVGQFQLAVYEVHDGDRQVTISVSAVGGDLATNVNRWREQVQLKRLEPAELEKEMRQIKVDGHDGVSVEAIGPETAKPRETILGVIVKAQDAQWFFKLRGDADLAAREKPNFGKFVESVRFRGK